MNRQVPEKIAIVGNGRMAKHMVRYFELLGQPHQHWFRSRSKSLRKDHPSRLAHFKHKLQNLFHNNSQQSLHDVVEKIGTVLLLLPDDQIETFIKANPCLNGKTLLHFSGVLSSEKAFGCHPLMTFADDLYDLKQYQSIPFVIDESLDFKQFLPLLNNPVYRIKPEQKNLYHAMCVMAGNFSHMLWQATGKELKKLGLPADLMNGYLMQNTQNFINNPDNALTGPFVRGDFKTIEKHQNALHSHPLEGLYQSFYQLNQQQPKEAAKRKHL